MTHILRVRWTNGVVEVIRSELAGADFRKAVPGVEHVTEIGYSLDHLRKGERK